MNVIGVIPARLESVRMPGKILLPFKGLPMVEHVRRRALLCADLDEVLVATGSEEIAAQIRKHGGEVAMTELDHVNGTSRAAEAMRDRNCSHVVLLQGDEPLLLPRHVSALVRAMRDSPRGDAWNVTAPLGNGEELGDRSCVKCAVDAEGRILLCFRVQREGDELHAHGDGGETRKIAGMIGFRKPFLDQFVRLDPGRRERSELIEQMRVIENGHELRSVPVAENLPEVNVPGDEKKVLARLECDREQRELLARILRAPERRADG